MDMQAASAACRDVLFYCLQLAIGRQERTIDWRRPNIPCTFLTGCDKGGLWWIVR